MAGTSRKQNKKETKKRGRQRLRRQLAKDPRITELLRKRWEKLRSLASDDKIRDETARIRKALETAYEHNPEAVEEFFQRFWYPSPANFLRARQFLERVRGSRSRNMFRLPCLCESFRRLHDVLEETPQIPLESVNT
jgi:hypothetical protein